jgi:hypothetical protein
VSIGAVKPSLRRPTRTRQSPPSLNHRGGRPAAPAMTRRRHEPRLYSVRSRPLVNWTLLPQKVPAKVITSGWRRPHHLSIAPVAKSSLQASSSPLTHSAARLTDSDRRTPRTTSTASRFFLHRVLFLAQHQLANRLPAPCPRPLSPPPLRVDARRHKVTSRFSQDSTNEDEPEKSKATPRERANSLISLKSVRNLWREERWHAQSQRRPQT